MGLIMPAEDLDKEIGALYQFFSTGEGEVFGGGGAYDIEELVNDVIDALKSALIDLLKENPNRTMSLVIDTDNYQSPTEAPRSQSMGEKST